MGEIYAIKSGENQLGSCPKAIVGLYNDFGISTHFRVAEPITADWFLELAQGNYAGTGNRREGIVVRPVCNVDSPTLAGLVSLTTESPRLTFKVLNNDYLLKDET